MGCDYYTQSELVIEYMDKNGTKNKITTNKHVERGYILSITNSDSDDDFETQNIKYENELKIRIDRNTYKKILYENNFWISSSYEKRYSPDLKFLCPNMKQLVKIYKNYSAWAANQPL